MYRRIFLLFGFWMVVALLLHSCKPTNYVYFSNMPDSSAYIREIAKQAAPKIQKNDALGIKVSTLNPEVNILFNSGSLPVNNGTGSVSANSSVTGTSVTLNDGYVVDQNGEINYPVLGKIKLEGLTIEEAQNKIAKLVSKTVKDPIVNVRLLNFKVTVIGEVSKPGTFTIPYDKVNVLQAIGMAGDLTAIAIRNDVLIIREKNGVRYMRHINLNDVDVFSSPFFYLEQNDIVYVRPNNRYKKAQANASDFRLWSVFLSSISILSIILVRLKSN